MPRTKFTNRFFFRGLASQRLAGTEGFSTGAGRSAKQGLASKSLGADKGLEEGFAVEGDVGSPIEGLIETPPSNGVEQSAGNEDGAPREAGDQNPDDGAKGAESESRKSGEKRKMKITIFAVK